MNLFIPNSKIKIKTSYLIKRNLLLLVRKKSTKGSSKEDQYKNCFICQSQTDITPTNSTDEIFNITEVADVVDKQIKIINLCGKCYKLCDIIVKSKKELKEQIKNVSTRSKVILDTQKNHFKLFYGEKSNFFVAVPLSHTFLKERNLCFLRPKDTYGC